MSEQQENYSRVGAGFYLVRTQAGFNQAVSDWDSDRVNGEKMPIEGYPRSYPSLVSFTLGYRGYSYINASCIHVNKLLPHLKDA